MRAASAPVWLHRLLAGDDVYPHCEGTVLLYEGMADRAYLNCWMERGMLGSWGVYLPGAAKYHDGMTQALQKMNGG